jgi:hypothetical protein
VVRRGAGVVSEQPYKGDLLPDLLLVLLLMLVLLQMLPVLLLMLPVLLFMLPVLLLGRLRQASVRTSYIDDAGGVLNEGICRNTPAGECTPLDGLTSSATVL